MVKTAEVAAVVGVGALAWMYRGQLGVTTSPARPASVAAAGSGAVWSGKDVNTYNRITHTSHYDRWTNNAADWFEQMGYPVSRYPLATRKMVLDQILPSMPKVYYHLVHGDFTGVQAIDCPANNPSTYCAESQCVTAKDYIAHLPAVVGGKGRFAFIGSCGAFDTGIGQTSARLRCGDFLPAFERSYDVVIGYRDLKQMKSSWYLTLSWQDELFKACASGSTVGEALSWANGKYPEMVAHYGTLGDLSTRLVS